MLFEIAHTTVYSYSRAVFLGAHTIRLRPRADFAQQPIGFELAIEPRPAGLSESLDFDGNIVAHAWFEGATETLTIKASSQTSSLERNPFDFILLDPGAEKLPARYAGAAAAPAAPYLVRPRASAAVDRWAGSIAQSAGGETLPFLTVLCREIHDASAYVVREDGDPMAPEETLRGKQGSCRDLAVLFMDACRAEGLAARFVSGYHDIEAHRDAGSMHAWSEVYLPGGGWRGYDPTLGVAVADGHIALAAAADPREAAPVSGSFRGSGALGSLKAKIEISSSR